VNAKEIDFDRREGIITNAERDRDTGDECAEFSFIIVGCSETDVPYFLIVGCYEGPVIN